MNKLRTGFIAPKIEADHFVLGGFGEDPLSAPIIKVDGNWFRYLPSFESQLEKTFDSDGCTVYGTLNALETQEKFITNKESNYSDRATYNAVGISPPGDDPHHVITVIRGSGLVLEDDCNSVVDTLAEFMTPRPLSTSLIVKGKQWFQKWQAPSHIWIITPDTKPEDKVRILKEQLLRGTVAISVCAWFQDQDGLYYSPSGMDNSHWTECYNVDDTGIYVFDSYLDARTGSFLKKLKLDHNIQYAKRYSLTPIDQTVKRNWLIDIIKSLWEVIFQLEKKKAIVINEEKKTMITK